MIVLITVLAAVAIMAIIVYTCRKQPADERKGLTGHAATTGNGSVSISAQNGCVAGSKTGRHVVYFVANGNRSPEVGRATVGGAKSDTVVQMCDLMDNRHHVTLFPERNVNDEGQLRVYRWEDF